MKKSVYSIIAGLLLLSLHGSAQSSYESAVGIRAGIPIAASFKHFISTAGAIEVNAGFWHDPVSYGFSYFTVGGMYQHHFDIGAVEGLRWYVGGGLLAQFYSYSSDWGDHRPSNFGFGVNAVGGIDYKFSSIPLNLSADWTPTIFLAKGYYSVFEPGYGGFCVRYTF